MLLRAKRHNLGLSAPTDVIVSVSEAISVYRLPPMSLRAKRHNLGLLQCQRKEGLPRRLYSLLAMTAETGIIALSDVIASVSEAISFYYSVKEKSNRRVGFTAMTVIGCIAYYVSPT